VAARPPRRRAAGRLATLLLLVLCPTFYGHMFINPKDAPFAVAMVVLMLAGTSCRRISAPSPRTILIIASAPGSRWLPDSRRARAGLCVFGFAPLLLEEVRSQGAREAAHRFAHVVHVLLPGLVFGIS